MFMEKYPDFSLAGGYRKYDRDPVKITTKLYHPHDKYPENDTLPDINHFAMLYFEKPDPDFNLLECEDIRKLLNLLSRAGCFDYIQAGAAFRLKKNYEFLVHNEIIQNRRKENVYEDVKTLLKTFLNTEKDLDDLETAWVYGVRILMKPRKDDQEKDNEIDSSQETLYKIGRRNCGRLHRKG